MFVSPTWRYAAPKKRLSSCSVISSPILIFWKRGVHHYHSKITTKKLGVYSYCRRLSSVPALARGWPQSPPSNQQQISLSAGEQIHNIQTVIDTNEDKCINGEIEQGQECFLSNLFEKKSPVSLTVLLLVSFCYVFKSVPRLIELALVSIELKKYVKPPISQNTKWKRCIPIQPELVENWTVSQTNLDVLMNLQFPIFWCQQVIDLFIVNFHVGNPQKELTIFSL